MGVKNKLGWLAIGSLGLACQVGDGTGDLAADLTAGAGESGMDGADSGPTSGDQGADSDGDSNGDPSGGGEPPTPDDGPTDECLAADCPYHIIDELGGMPRGQAQNEFFCSTPMNTYADDGVRERLCANGVSSLTGVSNLEELLGMLGLSLANPTGEGARFAMIAASPSISTRSVSAINPRVFIYQDELGAREQHVVVSYTRGEPYIEIMGRHDGYGSNTSEGRDVVNFYLVKFDKACEGPQTCVAADFLTDAFEQQWEQVSVYEDLQVQDTTLDCLHCHQPEGSDGPKVMLFAEDRPNFTHWFDGYSNYGGELSEDDAALYETFYAAHDPALGYGVIPSERIGESDPKELWTAMYLSGHLNKQPIEFRDIEREFNDDGSSATWDSLYASFLAGERPPVPVPQNTADDPDLIASATQVYQDFLAGSLSRSDLPDFRAVHRDDLLTSLGFRAQPDRTPEELLRNACGQCHNPSLSQATSKSRFDVTQLDTMPAAAFQTALDRIRRAPTDPLRMPPLRYRSLTIPQVDKLDAYLRERLEGGN